jgi:rsbT co-antagonist protein RsbR
MQTQIRDVLASVDDVLKRNLIEPEDLEHIRIYGKLMIPKLTNYVTFFYQWMENQIEYSEHFQEESRLRQVKNSQIVFWHSFFKAEINDQYLKERRSVGETHAKVGLSLAAYFGALSRSQDLFLYELYENELDHQTYVKCMRAVTKLIHLDAALVVEAYSRLSEAQLTKQTRALMEMSTPVTTLWDHILMLPVVGIIDSQRAKDMMHSVLNRIYESRSKVFIIDIGGVSVVDTAVANHLIKIMKASRLMGCTCIWSGVSPAIAQTIVNLGIDVGDILTCSTLRDALEEAFRHVGLKVKSGDED